MSVWNETVPVLADFAPKPGLHAVLATESGLLSRVWLMKVY